MNLYTLLGIRRTATPEEVDAAYHRRARNVRSKQGLQELVRVYEVLCDAQKRREYNTALVEHDSSTVAGAGVPMPVAHPLADDPRNFARVLLELRGPACWSAALRGLSVQQLKQLIAPLSDLGEGKKTQHLQRNDDDQVGLSLCNLHAIGKNYRVEVQWSGLKLLSVATSCATAVIFYHSCLMRLRKMLSDVIGSTPDCNHEEAVRRAFDEWMHHGFTCPVVFQYHINRQAKLVLPCVQSLELALQMRRQALQATPARLRGLKAQWLRQAEEEALARHERTTRRAQQLIGFVLCRAQNLEPTVRMRKSGKQAPDLAIQVPVSESIARRLGETCESMQRRFASAEGQEALYRFLLNDVAKDPRAPMQAWAAQARRGQTRWKFQRAATGGGGGGVEWFKRFLSRVGVSFSGFRHMFGTSFEHTVEGFPCNRLESIEAPV